MKLVHEVTVATPVDEVLPRLRGAEYSGSLRVRLAGAQITYRGTVRVESAQVDDLTAQEFPLTVHVAATEARGDGAVTATASVVLTATGRPKVKTKASADIDLAVTGRAAAADEAALGETTRRLLRDLVTGPRVAAPAVVPDPAVNPVSEPAAEPPAEPIAPKSAAAGPAPDPAASGGPGPAATPDWSAPAAASSPPVRILALAGFAVLLLLLLRRLRRG